MADGDPNPGDQGNPGNPNPGGDPPAGGAPQPITINAETLGEYKDDPVFKPFEGKGLGEVFKSFKNAQTLIGGEKLAIPAGKLDTPENWQHVFNKLGRPQTADGYKLEVPKLPDGMKYDENFAKGFKEVSHYLGLLPWQVAGLHDFYNKAQVDAFSRFEAAEAKRAEETEDMLVKELGTREKYDEYVKGADAALKRFGGDPQTVQAFVDKFGNDPLVVKVFGNVAKGMMEDAALRGDKTFNLMGEDAAGKLKDIQYNKSNPLYDAYWKKDHPQHAYAVAEVTRLNEQIHGNKPINMEG